MGINIKRISNKKWLLDVRVKSSCNKERRKREIFHGSKQDAEKRFTQLRDELHKSNTSYSSLKFRPAENLQKKHIDKESFSSISQKNELKIFKNLMQKYFTKRASLSESHRRKCKTLLLDLGSIHLTEFADKFEEYIEYLRQTPSEKTGKIRSNATINRFIEIVRAVFCLAVDLEIIEKNPITKARFPKYEEIPRDRYLTKDERSRLLKVINETPRIRHILYIVKFALQVPSRTHDLISLTRENLNLDKKTIDLKNGTTKNKHGCIKPIPPNMIDYFTNLPKEANYLFYRKCNNKYLPLGDFKHAWQTAKKIAGISDLRFHDLRATSATDLSNNGTNDHVLMLIGNWKTRAMLDRYYRRDVDKIINCVKFN